MSAPASPVVSPAPDSPALSAATADDSVVDSDLSFDTSADLSISTNATSVANEPADVACVRTARSRR